MTEKVTRENLFDLDGRIEKMKIKEVEAIILEVCADDRENQWERKVVSIELRNLSQAQLDASNQQKVNAYLKKFGIYLDGASVVFAIGAAFAGQSVSGGLFKVASDAFSKTSEQEGKKTQSEITGYDHTYQRIGRLLQDHGQQIQEKHSECKKMTDLIDRLEQTIQRTFELMASSGS
jgi:hypothetical protein